jgi:hypothetical protein
MKIRDFVENRALSQAGHAAQSQCLGGHCLTAEASPARNTGMMPLRVGILVGVFAFAFIAGIMNTGMWGWRTWYRLSTVGRKAEARVTAASLSSAWSFSFFDV